MARVPLEAFFDVVVRQIYLAAKLDEGRRVEAVLDGIGVQYAVRIESYSRVSWLFFWPIKLEGAAFYVPAERADECGQALRAAGLLAVVEEDPNQVPTSPEDAPVGNLMD